MEFRTLHYLQNEGYIQYNLIMNQVKNDYEKLPEFFRNLIKGLRAINLNKIPTDEVYENYYNFPTFTDLSTEVIDYLSEIVSNCNYEEVVDHSEFGENLLNYIQYILKGTYKNK